MIFGLAPVVRVTLGPEPPLFSGAPEAGVSRPESGGQAGRVARIHQRDRRLVTDGTKRPDSVVAPVQSVQFFRGICKRQEAMSVQALRQEAAVEGIHEGIVGRNAGPGEVRVSRRRMTACGTGLARRQFPRRRPGSAGRTGRRPSGFRRWKARRDG
jgi:hypothetical protein